MMEPIYVDVPSVEAVQRAQDDLEQHGDAAVAALDRHLRWRLIRYLQDRHGDLDDLRRALIAAVRWARRQQLAPWDGRFTWMLELLRAARRSPSVAADLELLLEPGCRAAEVLALLAARDEALRPKTIAEELGLSKQQVSNLLRQLDERRLAARTSVRGGRAVWVTATARGIEAAARLRPATRESVVEPRSAAAGARAGKISQPLAAGAPAPSAPVLAGPAIWNENKLNERVPTIH